MRAGLEQMATDTQLRTHFPAIDTISMGRASHEGELPALAVVQLLRRARVAMPPGIEEAAGLVAPGGEQHDEFVDAADGNGEDVSGSPPKKKGSGAHSSNSK